MAFTSVATETFIPTPRNMAQGILVMVNTAGDDALAREIVVGAIKDTDLSLESQAKHALGTKLFADEIAPNL